MNWIGLYTFIRREFQRMMRIAIQTLVTPWISALLYIFVFGRVIGSRIDLIAGVPYIEFVLPGILMMNVIMSSFSHSSSSLYMARFLHNIEEILTAPFSYLEMIMGYVSAAVVRGLIVGAGIFVIALLFGGASITHIGLFFLYIIAVSTIFALFGLVIGLWANNFEQLGIIPTFFLMPMTFLGGAFYSIEMLPPAMRVITRFNPMFYFIDGIRYSMIGVGEANLWVGAGVIVGMIVIMSAIVWYLFKIGWRLRE